MTPSQHPTPPSTPSEEHARTLTGQPKGHGALGISMKDDRVVPPPPYPGGCHLCVLACPLAKVRGEPSSAMSVNKKGSHLTTTPPPSPPRQALSVFSFHTLEKGILCCRTDDISALNRHPPTSTPCPPLHCPALIPPLTRLGSTVTSSPL